jgi:hypothetical protein
MEGELARSTLRTLLRGSLAGLHNRYTAGGFRFGWNLLAIVG